MCRHCRKRVATRPRQLCFPCYYIPGLRERYPVTSKFGRRGIGNGSHGIKPASDPTNSPPGSDEKIAVLEARALRREHLWHPHDRTSL